MAFLGLALGLVSFLGFSALASLALGLLSGLDLADVLAFGFEGAHIVVD